MNDSAAKANEMPTHRDPYAGFEDLTPTRAVPGHVGPGVDPYAEFERVAPAPAALPAVVMEQEALRNHREGLPPDPNRSSPDKPPGRGDFYRTFVEPFTDWSSERGLVERGVDATNYLIGSVAPHAFRLPSAGELIESATGLPGARESEERFVEHNPKVVNMLGAIGEVAPGLAPTPTPTLTPRARSMPPVPRSTAPAPLRPTAVQPSSLPSSGPARARAYVRDLDNLGISRHGPAIAQAARDADGLGTVAKVIEGMPVVSRPLRRSTDNFVQSSARAADTIAQGYSQGGGNIARAGARVRSYVDDFVNERSIARDAIEAMSDVEVRALASRVPRDVQSFKTAQDARYESAWREIPKDMRQGGSFVDEPRLMGDMPSTRQALMSMYEDNLRMINRQRAERAAGRPRVAEETAGVLPTRQGARIKEALPFRGGRLGSIVEDVVAGNWTGSLQTMRNIRSLVRRIDSKTPDKEGNVLDKAQLERLKSTITTDMTNLMRRIASDYRVSGDVAKAESFERAALGFFRADRFTRRYAEGLDDVKRLTRASTDEQVIGTIIRAAQAGSKGDQGLLLQLRRIAPPEVLDDVAAAVLNELGRPTGRAGGVLQDAAWSSGKYSSGWNSLSPTGRFHIFGHRPSLYHKLQAYARVAQGMADYEALANTSRSGTHTLTGAILLAGPGAVIGSLKSILLSGAAAYGAARWLTSSAYVSWLTRATVLERVAWEGRLKGREGQRRVRELGRDLKDIVKIDHTLEPAIAQAMLIAIDRGMSGEPIDVNDPVMRPLAAPMHLGGPDPDGMLEDQPVPLPEVDPRRREAPRPGDVITPQNDLRSRTPTLKEDAAAWFGRQFGDSRESHEVGRQLADALDLMSLFALSGASDAERNVREGSYAGDTGQVGMGVVEGALPFLPGARFGKKAAEKLAQEIKGLEREIETLTGKAIGPRPRPMSGTTGDEIVKGEQAYRDRLADEVANRRAELARANEKLPPGSVPSVDPRTMQAERAYAMTPIESNPYVQAIKGRQGFPTKAEQKALVEQYFKGGGRLPQAPWGLTQGQASEVARDILAVSFAARSRAEQRAIVHGAEKQLTVARDRLAELDRKRLLGQAGEIGELRTELAAAKREVEEAIRQRNFWQRLYDEVIDKLGK